MHDTSLIQGINESSPPVRYPENGCSVRQVSLTGGHDGTSCIDYPVEEVPLLQDKKEVTQGYDFVNHPKHYNKHPSGVECKEIIQWFSFNIGTAMKHLWRANHKPGVDIIQDLQKAKQYIEFEIQRLGSQGE